MLAAHDGLNGERMIYVLVFELCVRWLQGLRIHTIRVKHDVCDWQMIKAVQKDDMAKLQHMLFMYADVNMKGSDVSALFGSPVSGCGGKNIRPISRSDVQ